LPASCTSASIRACVPLSSSSFIVTPAVAFPCPRASRTFTFSLAV
jgi:hypothetical protein